MAEEASVRDFVADAFAHRKFREALLVPARNHRSKVDSKQTKGRDNREHELRPKPTRQSSTLPVRGRAMKRASLPLRRRSLIALISGAGLAWSVQACRYAARQSLRGAGLHYVADHHPPLAVKPMHNKLLD